MGGIGIPELIIILVIVLVIFGAGKLPQLGESLGKGIRNFRKASKGDDEVDVTPSSQKELPPGQTSVDDVDVERVKTKKQS
ncbi:MAG: twin-arginine translocase TatA/TatE family subunit [Myxococcales bacterium]|nr:twin-arginine translocase TatA/TatE family subunit [Myxococcales bacterium]